MKKTDILIKIAGGECVGIGCDRCGDLITTSLDTPIHDILDMCDQEPHLCDSCRAIEEAREKKKAAADFFRSVAGIIENGENDDDEGRCPLRDYWGCENCDLWDCEDCGLYD